MKKQLFILVCTFIFGGIREAKAQTPFNPNSYSGWLTTPSNYFATLPAGSGVTFTQPSRGQGNQFSTATDGINSGQWQNVSSSDAIAANRYFTFSASANSSTSFQVDSLLLILGRSGTGPDSCILQYKSPATGYNFVPVTSTVHTILNPTTNPTTSLLIVPATSILVSSSDSVVFRLVAWHASSSLGKMRIMNNTQIFGKTMVAIPPSISAPSLQTGNGLCVSSLIGDSVQVTFNSIGTFNTGNTYSLELSDASGSFSTPVTIGSVSSQLNNGTIHGFVPAGTANASYRLRIKSSNPAINGLDTTNLFVNAGIELTALVLQPTCPDSTGKINLAITGGSGVLQYDWSNGETTASLDSLAAGTYTVTITDIAGCSKDSSFQILSIPAFNVTQTIENVSCHSANDGQISVLVTGATAPYAISWTGNGINITGSTATNLLAGNYNLTITDGNNCVYTNVYSVTEPTPVNMSAVITHATCASCIGNIAVTVSGGNAPYSFEWGNNSTANQIVGTPGTYCLEVTDGNDCMTDSCFVISSTAGINELSQSSAEVFPNPASDMFQVVFSAKLNGLSKEIRVTDLFGKVVYENSISGETQQISVPVKTWANGTYSYQILNENGTSESGRIVVVQ
ncbi:T9SS type A sorting domain-containing protein [Fluviicola sp.]|uniref:T9SS type A sorting domain-containing protein n=1 Tax=Fluviicola sp. TaxID=1917219 RepID=UPI00262886F2|nr:T9SS type A sorting domain-containing protein [Fluviicola sp.]